MHTQMQHLQNSLNFHLFSGDTDKLIEAIIELVKRYE
ncbi:hypothetical protein LCY76_14555 [Fictibacillus sp. KIGAM418]|uniref:Uncharacterized protein n=1 Tax=Fictibacillus marinisediminis TaxID=2878389 RepID=A0A9X1XHK5_9BACL|nr:hypothetical protein [Fictibacillus marinisediminis]